MKRERIGIALTALAFVLALFVAAVVPSRAWAPGSEAITHAPILNVPRVVSVETGLAFAPREGGVLIETGDGGGAGLIEGLGAPLRVRAVTYRDRDGWEIGTREHEPATYVDDNGVRIDDTMSDRLRIRAWGFAPIALVIGVLILVGRRRRT